MNLHISSGLSLPENEIMISAVRSGGPGGQNVNKVSSAVHLRFDIPSSSLPEDLKQRLLHIRDGRVTRAGILVIKAQRFRSREMNREDAVNRLKEFIMQGTAQAHTERLFTRPTRASKKRRIESKIKRGKLKSLRRRITIS